MREFLLRHRNLHAVVDEDPAVVGAFSLAEAFFAKGFAIAVLLLVTCIA